MAGRPAQQRCKYGHDKYARHGSYLASVRGFTYSRCAECERNRGKQRSKSRTVTQ